MQFIIVYNGFWNPDGPPETVRRLVEAAASRGRLLTPVANTAMAAEFSGGAEVPAVRLMGADEPDRPGTALFWDKDVRLARAMEAAGWRVCNSADAVAVCDDKAATHLALARRGVPMPYTLVAPMTYTEATPPGINPFLDAAAARLGFPLVVKECYGSLGGQVYLARDRGELADLAGRMGPRPFLCQEFVAAAKGCDTRLYVVGDRVVAAMRRRAPAGDFRSNVGGGGAAAAHVPTAEETALALRCCRLLGLRFGGVDLLDGGGRPLVCEVNASAFMTALEACTGADVAGAVIDCV